MAKVLMNPVVRFIQGKVGDVVFKRQGDGVILARKSVSKKPPSAAQLAQRERFRQATLYGRLVTADPERKAVYAQRAESRRKPLISLIIRDFMNVPVVAMVDLSQFRGEAGDRIVVLADDDFGVVGVTVQILGENGRLLAEGAAVEEPEGSRRWVYAFPSAGSGNASTSSGDVEAVVVQAVDRPGNVGEKIVNC